MSSPTGREPRFSDDRQWWWNGEAWVAANQAPPPPGQAPSAPSVPAYQPTPAQQVSAPRGGGVPTWMALVGLVVCFPVGIVLTLLTRWSVAAKTIAIGVVVALVVAVGIGVAASPKTTPTAQRPGATATPSPVLSTPGQSPKPPSPAPTPTGPKPIVLSSKGSKVLPVTLAEAPYRVSWTTRGGPDNMIVHIRQDADDQGLVNQIPPKPSSGQEFFLSPGGKFVVVVQAPTLTWKITFTQISWPSSPNPTPQRSVIAFHGQGSVVTNPMYIPTGDYKLAWTAKGGPDNFIVHVEWDGGEGGLVNEIPPKPRSGETIFFSGGDEHLFAVDAATLTWTITLTPI